MEHQAAHLGTADFDAMVGIKAALTQGGGAGYRWVIWRRELPGRSVHGSDSAGDVCHPSEAGSRGDGGGLAAMENSLLDLCCRAFGLGSGWRPLGCVFERQTHAAVVSEMPPTSLRVGDA